MATYDDVRVDIQVVFKLFDDATKEHKPDWISCQAGCSWCCWSMNSLISWSEAVVMLEAIRGMSAEEREAIALRAKQEVELLLTDPDIAYFSEGRKIEPDELDKLNQALNRHLRPCALLDRKSGKCTIYNARPLACRTFGHTVVQIAGDNDGARGLFCRVIDDDFRDSRMDTQFLDATPFFKAIHQMAGAPNVFALPIAFWIHHAANGGNDWSLDNPEKMFENVLPFFRELKTEPEGEDEP